MKDPEHHSITKAIKLLRIWLTRKKRLMVQAEDLQRQLADAWREKDQLKAENEALKEVRYLPIPCPVCNRLRVEYDPVSKTVVCEKCGADADVMSDAPLTEGG